jgi:hypothetical protein
MKRTGLRGVKPIVRKQTFIASIYGGPNTSRGSQYA